jgi:hypothetical protein
MIREWVIVVVSRQPQRGAGPRSGPKQWSSKAMMGVPDMTPTMDKLIAEGRVQASALAAMETIVPTPYGTGVVRATDKGYALEFKGPMAHEAMEIVLARLSQTARLERQVDHLQSFIKGQAKNALAMIRGE